MPAVLGIANPAFRASSYRQAVPAASARVLSRSSGLRQWQACRSSGFSRFMSTMRASVAQQTVQAPVDSHSAAGEKYGFEIVKREHVKEYDSDVILYRHTRTGAELISVINSDENKTFGVVLRTPVSDSTGIPHILEHSVLCGSRKYPIKEPFVELMKGSLNTFLNAFTYPDRTCYPVASANLQDFYNLVDVYLDAVFHPRCVSDEKVFEQEGWHLELDDPSHDITYKGVVFNEMKGVYSSPDSVNGRTIQQVLFPDNNYRHDSGGDPAVIPKLTFEQFQEFHSKYYHPSNARFWFYGDDAPEERLRILNEYLKDFDKKEVDSRMPAQPLFNEPRSHTGYYAAGQSEDGEEKAFVTMNWVLSQERLDLDTELALDFLDYLLTGTNAAPLVKALKDSGLGEAVVGGGIEGDLRQPIYSIGLKGVKPENAQKVLDLIVEVLQARKREGFTPAAIEAAVNTIEFSLRENNTGSFPRGLSLMLRAMSSWIYDSDPIEALKWEHALNSLKQRLAAGEDVFSPLIDKYFLNNNHRVSVQMLPDSELGAKLDNEERATLDKIRSQLSEQQVQEVVDNTADLKMRQETPDAPEALACVPCLQLSDIPDTITTVPTALSEKDGTTLLQHDLFTNDILYSEVGLDMRGVEARLLPLVPLFCRSLTNMGTEKESFIDLTDRIGRKTGGISVSPWVSDKRGSDEPVAFIMMRSKAMVDKVGDMMELKRDLLLTARLDDQQRFKQMVLETRAGLESALVAAGHRFAGSRLSAQRSVAGWVNEQMSGLSYLQYIRQLAKRVDEDWEGIQKDLEAIRSAILNRAGSVVNLTADEGTLSAAAPHVDALLSALPSNGGAAQHTWSNKLPRVNEAIVVPTQVNYVAKAANLYEDTDYKLHGSTYVVDKYLGTTWIWDQVRVVGGAYGGFSSFNSHSGGYAFMSYRDPNLLKTLKAYDGSAEFLRKLTLDQDSLTKAIIGTIGDIDAYQLPDAKGHAQFTRHLLGVTDEERQQRRHEILGTKVEDFQRFGEVLAAATGDAARIAVVTSADAAKKASEEQPGLFDEIHEVL